MLLLDTNALIWYLIDPNVLTDKAAQAIRAAPSLATSAASVWEVATKYRSGKLSVMAPLMADGLLAVLAAHGIEVIPISGPDAERAASHPAAHRDPFDRLIATQAALRRWSIVSSDVRLDLFGATRIW